MKRVILALSILALALTAEGQTVYLPNGAGGIGTSSNDNVGIGTSSPQAKFNINTLGFSSTANSTYPTASSRGDIVQLLESNNNGIEIGNAKGLNDRKVWILGRHNDLNYITLGTFYSTLHLQPDVGNKTNYQGVAIGYSANTSLTNGTHLAVNGNVGIGTISPKAKLHINSGANNPYAAILATSDEDNNLVVSSFSTQPSNGKVFSLAHEFYGNNRNNGAINFYRGGSEEGGFLTFDTYGKERLRINDAGNVGIGTTSPQYKLDVKGQIRATEVLVQSVDQFADFVFDKDYRLPSLHEVNTFIQDNGHLPGIPSAQEVKENGMNLVEMQVKLLQKVEELTLYSIKQQEEIKVLKDELNKLKNK